MKTKTPIACLSAVLSAAALHADIAPDDTLMEVTWFENAVTESKAGWSGYGLVYANEKYTLDVERAVSFTPVAQTGKAVRQVFDIDLRPVDRLPEVDAGAQTAFVVRATDAGQILMAWGRTTPEAAPDWHTLGAPVYGKRLALEIDYDVSEGSPAAVRYYLTDDAGDTPFGGTLYSANAQTQVTQYDFTGSGTLASLVGTQTADTAAIVDGVKYVAADVTDELLVTGLARGTVKVFDASLVPDGCAVNAQHELSFLTEDPDAPQDGLLYYFPLEGTVANVGGSRGGRYVSVGGELVWDDSGWTGSPFGTRSLCSGSAETKVENADGLVPAGSRWTVSFWVNASREDWAWKDACGFRIGEQVYNFELVSGEALQLYGKPGDYLHENNGWDKPIVCGDDWVNVSVVCNAARDGVDVYVNGTYHASVEVANADNLTAFYFGANGLREPAAPSMVFVDEVSIWGRALDSSQLAYLAAAPATEKILIDGFWYPPEGEMLYYFPLEGTVENVGGTRGMRDVTVGDELTWDDDGWTGSPFGERSLRCTSDETTVCNADGLVAAGSRWTVSFWLNLSCEAWDWKNACGFRIGEQIYNFRKGSGPELHLFGGPGDYLHLENDTDEKPIVCGADWVNVSLVCRTALDGVDVYVNGTYHASLFVADADRLTGFYFTENGLSDEGRKYSCVFIDEVSIWSCALDADQLAYLAAHPAMEEILYVKKGWARVTERTRFAEVPGLTPAQARSLSATGVVALRLARWAVAHDVPYGAEIDVAAFAMNCDSSDKATEAAKLRLTIEMDGEEPIVGVLTDADGEPVTKNWNVQPTIKGKVRLSDAAWGDRNAEGVRFFKAFLDL